MNSTSTIDFQAAAHSNPSLCIPRVFNNISENRIRAVFNQVGLGEISKVDMVTRKNEQGTEYKRVFIHFTHWFDNPNANEARRRVLNGDDIKIVYDTPWFWNISMSNWKPKPKPQTQAPIRKIGRAHARRPAQPRPR